MKFKSLNNGKTQFADCEDRIGIIQASSMDKAVEKLRKYNEQNSDWGAYEIMGEPKVDLNKDLAIISYDVVELDHEGRRGRMGKDDYAIRSVGSDTLMFLAQDWNLTFD